MMEKEIKGEKYLAAKWRFEPNPDFVKFEKDVKVWDFIALQIDFFYVLKAVVSIMLILQKTFSFLGLQITFCGDLSLPFSSFVSCFVTFQILYQKWLTQEITVRTSNKNLQVCKKLGFLAWCRLLPTSSWQSLHCYAIPKFPKHGGKKPSLKGSVG